MALKTIRVTCPRGELLGLRVTRALEDALVSKFSTILAIVPRKLERVSAYDYEVVEVDVLVEP